MKTLFVLLISSLMLSGSIGFAEELDRVCNQLPGCTIDAVEVPCKVVGGDLSTIQIAGCSITCPADRLPVCNAGKSNTYCDLNPTPSKCECK